MDELDGTGGHINAAGAAVAEGISAGIDQRRANAFAAHQRAVTHRFGQTHGHMWQAVQVAGHMFRAALLAV